MSGSAFGTFFLPGPTEVRREVLEAMLAPMIPHRGSAFEQMLARIDTLLRQVFRTARPVYVGSCSATGFMEMAIRCAPPGRILSLVNGAFSERFADIARACGREVDAVHVRPGEIVEQQRLHDALRARRYVALTVAHSETSTGALTPLAPIGAIARLTDTLTLVDSVTGLAGAPVETDLWGLDVVLTGSQKALAMPPGLAFAAVSERYLERARTAEHRGRYFDVLEFEAYAARHQTPNTPALSLLFAAKAQLEHIVAETMETRWARHDAMARETYRWAERESLPIVAHEGARSPTVTAFTLPDGLRPAQVTAAVTARGYTIGGGYGLLKDTTIRVGHMGDHTVDALRRCLDAVSDALASLR